jgi:hypothetical protein
MKYICIIYKLINRVNGKLYIGQTWQSLKDRWENGCGYYCCPISQATVNRSIKYYKLANNIGDNFGR